MRSRKRESLNQEIDSGHVSSVDVPRRQHRLAHRQEAASSTPKTETFDDAEANKYLGREHRKGFELPSVV